MPLNLGHRAGRFCRSLIPCTTFILFAFLLTFLFILYHPSLGPTHKQRITWQAWDTIIPPQSAQLPTSGNTAPSKGNGTTSEPNGPDVTTAWWGKPLDPIDDVHASQQLDRYAPLLPHMTGLTMITVKPCLIDPVFTTYCNPSTTPELDAKYGKWVRVDRDMNKQAGVWWNFIYYRRSRRVDVPLITDIRIVDEGDEGSIPDNGKTWKQAEGILTDGIYPRVKNRRLWYSLQKPYANATQGEELDDVVTELDILYGEDEPFWGFKRVEGVIYPGRPGKSVPISLVARKGYTSPPRPQPPHFHANGTYKIMQVADLHYSVTHGQCMDTDLKPCDGFNSSQAILAEALDAERPDLVVFSGDQLNGQRTSWDSRSVLAKFASEVIKRKIPWAAVFGNHDSTTDMDRKHMMEHLQHLPYSLAEPGPSGIHGVGNYVVQVKSYDDSATPLLTLYFLDSGAYVSKGLAWWKELEYDYLRESQIMWFLDESQKIHAIERPFTQDGTRDLGKIWKRRDGKRRLDLEERQATTGGNTPGGKKLAKPNAMMFFHIPLKMSTEPADTNPETSQTLDVGSAKEYGGSPKDAGFFKNAILAAPEVPSTTETKGTGTEVKVIANGHVHTADNCRRVKGVWTCFGGGGSYAGYGKLGFDRRFRIFQISQYGEKIETHKRTDKGKIIDKMVLVGEGAAPAFEGAL
ncbi:Metallo-dependent phosphatase [Rhizoctonia solani]|nr:Metallo-dependent phosphatase [Rhizoctonia solani]